MDNNRGAKRKAEDDGSFQLRVLCPSGVTGKLLGKNRSNLRKLNEDNKPVVIDVHKIGLGPEIIVSFLAGEAEQILNALEEVVTFLDYLLKAKKDEGFEGGFDERWIDIRVLVHNDQIGHIVGKGGGNIRELKKSTNTRIKIFERSCPRSSEQVVSVIGDVDDVHKAIRKIMDIIENNRVEENWIKYHPRNFDEELAIQYGGYGRSDEMKFQH